MCGMNGITYVLFPVMAILVVVSIYIGPTVHAEFSEPRPNYNLLVDV
jgi:hypothetical protein